MAMLQVSGRQGESDMDDDAVKLKAIFDNISGTVYRIAYDPDGTTRMLFLSAGCESLYGRSAEEIMAMSHAERMAIHRAVEPNGFETFVDSAPDSHGGHEGVFEILRPDGTFRWAMIRGRVTGREGDSVIIDGITLDVTAEVEAKRELELRREELGLYEARKLEALGRLAGGVSHDFNNLLGSILGFAEFIGEDIPPNHRAQKYVRGILSAASRGKEVVDQIMAFSRQKVRAPARFELADLIEDCAPRLRQVIPPSITIIAEVCNHAVEVVADKGQLAQVLMNLCVNARDAMDTQVGTITIGLKVLPPDDPLLVRCASRTGPENDKSCDSGMTIVGQCTPGHAHAVFSVRDNGAGMSPEVLARLFEPFFTTKGVGKGAGLGLSVVHGIVMEHGGAIAVTSRLRRGSEFQVILPLAEPREVEILSAQPLGTSRLGRILVVDDDPDFGDSLSTLLKRQGWSPTNFSDPRLAAEALRNSPMEWDLLLTDQVMPHLRGQDLIRLARRVRPDLPCILCSGYSNSLDDDLRAGRGLSGVFQKPVDFDALFGTIGAAVGPRQP